MTKQSDSPGFGGVPLPKLGPNEDFSLEAARKRLGETFEPIPTPELPPADPELDRAVAELETMWTGAGTRRSNPVAGPENPLAPPVQFYGCDDGSVRAEVTLGPVYQGPPGCVHGGISALIIDHMMGFANHWGGRFGMTAHYEIDYRSPTPLLEPLSFRAWVQEREGRKTWTHATIHAGERLCVEARGLFLEASVPVPGQPGTESMLGDGA